MRDFITRTAYLAYNLQKTDRSTFKRFSKYVIATKGRSKSKLLRDILHCVYRYNISPLDYFYFRFFDLGSSDREKWAGTGFMYEYQKRMNPLGPRKVLEDKISFLSHFRQFVRRPFANLEQLRRDSAAADEILRDSSGRIVIKNSRGQCGKEVKILDANRLTAKDLIDQMSRGFDLVEGFVTQHRHLMSLSPSALNTVRLFTQIDRHGQVQSLGARLRISINSAVDNLAAGNIAAPINLETGVVSGPGVYSDITLEDVAVHPVTERPIIGFQIPFWSDVVKLTLDAAKLMPQNRSVGWDIAISDFGPELIEGNHNWCKLLWQLPAKQGLKHLLEQI